MKWNLFDEIEPDDGQVVFVAFRDDDDRSVDLCMYTPNFIVPLCVEDEGQWKGMSSTECGSAWAWADSRIEYPKGLEPK